MPTYQPFESYVLIVRHKCLECSAHLAAHLGSTASYDTHTPSPPEEHGQEYEATADDVVSHLIIMSGCVISHRNNFYSLKTLLLNNNDLKSLPASVAGWTTLELLHVHENHIQQLPDDFRKLCSLRRYLTVDTHLANWRRRLIVYSQ